MFCFQSGVLLQRVKHPAQPVLDTSAEEVKTLALRSTFSVCGNFMYSKLLGKLYRQSLILRYFCSLNVTALGKVLKCFLKNNV